MNNEEKIDALADMLEPLSVIFTDEEIEKANSENAPIIKIVYMALKRHKKEVIELLAISDGVPVEEYELDMMTIPRKLIKLINTKEVLDLFR